MNLNELMNEVTMAGWKIKVEMIRICMVCLIEGGEDSYGVALNHEDKLAYIANLNIVESDDCDFASDHLDYKIQEALKTLLEQGKIKMVVEDGQVKYMKDPSGV